MRRSTIVGGVLALSLAVAACGSGFAQRGGHAIGGVGVGAGAGAGLGNGVGAGANTGLGARAGNLGVGAGAEGNLGVHAPTTTLATNTKLNTSLTTALGKSGISVPGGNLQSACSGFRNLGDCVAAMHVAKNLDIAGGFDALKAKMTGSGSVSLGKAIQELDPNVDAKAAAKAGNRQASADLNAVGSVS